MTAESSELERKQMELNKDKSPFYGKVNGIKFKRDYCTGGGPFVHTKDIIGERYYEVRFGLGGMGNSIFFDEDMNVLHNDAEDSDLFDFDIEPLAREVVEFMVETFPPTE